MESTILTSTVVTEADHSSRWPGTSPAPHLISGQRRRRPPRPQHPGTVTGRTCLCCRTLHQYWQCTYDGWCAVAVFVSSSASLHGKQAPRTLHICVPVMPVRRGPHSHPPTHLLVGDDRSLCLEGRREFTPRHREVLRENGELLDPGRS
jgi:hypothetical protein